MATLVISISILMYLSSCCSAQFSWSDCGTPLSKIIYYQDVTVFPGSVQVGQQIAIYVKSYFVYEVLDADSIFTVWRATGSSGEPPALVLNVMTYSLCDLVKAEVTCPIQMGQRGFTTAYTAPSIPAGSYIFQLSNVVQGTEIGCLSISINVTDATQPSSCTYDSNLNADVVAVINHLQGPLAPPSQRQPGDWLQIGPVGSNAGIEASTLPWGTITSLTGSDDIILNGIIPIELLPHYVWAANGTMISKVTTAGIIYETYTGDLNLAYLSNPPTSTPYSIFYYGFFQLVFTVYPSPDAEGRIESIAGTFEFIPKWTQPINFTYPLQLGNLNSLSFSENFDETYSILGTKTYCICAVDQCGVCGGDGKDCSTSKSTGLSLYAKGTIIVGVVGGVVGIVAFGIFALLAKKLRQSPRIDDTDLNDPSKPDYGSLAINEVIQQGDEENE